MYRETHFDLDAPKENATRSQIHFAWWPTTYILESENERTVKVFWLKHYEVIERYRKLYCWKSTQYSFYEWHTFSWCLDTVRLLTKEEYRARTNRL